MANGKVTLGKQSGGTLGLVFPDGATHTEVTLPESGTLATLASPAFTGTPTAPTQTAGDNSTKVATTAYVDGKMVLGTAVNSTSGTSIDFTGIPSWVKRITVMFSGVSTNGLSTKLMQLGSTTIQTTGYSSTAWDGTAALYSSGFGLERVAVAAALYSGKIEIVNINSNNWVASFVLNRTDVANVFVGGGSVTLSGVLDRIRITTSNGTDTFDAGQINILYEG